MWCGQDSIKKVRMRTKPRLVMQLRQQSASRLHLVSYALALRVWRVTKRQLLLKFFKRGALANVLINDKFSIVASQSTER